MMAVNESQNQVINQVLEGPVSQQAQRQLAQIKAVNDQNPELDALAKTNRVSGAKARPLTQKSSLVSSFFVDPKAKGDKSSANQEIATGAQAQAALAVSPETSSAPMGALAAGSRIFGNLQGGRTLVKGLETGKIFSPGQLNSFQKKNGLTLVTLSPKGANHKLASLAQEANGQETSSMSQVAAKASQKALNPSQVEADKDLSPEYQRLKGESGAKIEAIIQKVAGALGLDPALIKAVVKTESNFNQTAVSKAGAKGLMQLMPKTAKEMGVSDPFNPLENIWGGARYLKSMLDRHNGNLNQALAAYNWGPGNLDRNGSSRLPKETRRYIEMVNRNYARYKKESQVA
jgi:hypothetical protein